MRWQLIFLIIILVLFGCEYREKIIQTENKEEIKLPAPSYDSETSLEKTLYERRSRRDYTDESLSLKDLSQLLWAAQGITSEWGGRTAPSAGATYPLEVYVVVGNVENLSPGVYHYNPEKHSINMVLAGDKRKELQKAALGQPWVGDAAVDIVIAAVYERTTGKYGDRGVRYILLEAGHAAQNVYLQCESLGLGTVVIGAFSDQQVKGVLNIEEEPVYIVPVGHPKD